MFDEKDTSRHVHRGARNDPDKTVVVDSSAFFAPETAQPTPPPPAKKPPKKSSAPAPQPPRRSSGNDYTPPKRGSVLLILQAILSVAAFIQLCRTQMLPTLYLVIIAALLVLFWLLVKRCQEYKAPGTVSRVFSVFLCAVLAVGCVWAQQGLAALDNVTSGLISAALASGIGENLPTLIPAVVDAIITITEGLIDHIDLLIIAAGQLIAGLAQGLIEAIPRLIGRLPEIISAIVNGLLKGMASIGMVGQQLVEGLWNGIKNAATWLYDKLSGWVSDILGWIKGFFGIHSPSKVFGDEVGKFIPPGITLGVEQAMPRAMRAMGDELAALTDIPLPGAGSTTTTNMGGVVLNVYGAEGQDVNALADAVMYRLQSAVERREAVFA